MLTQKAKTGFYRMLRFGCYFKLIPFDWDPDVIELLPASPVGLSQFHFHEIAIYTYTSVGTAKFIYHWKFTGKDFPLLQRLLSMLWMFAFYITSIGLIQLHLRREDIMRYANRMLEIVEGVDLGN